MLLASQRDLSRIQAPSQMKSQSNVVSRADLVGQPSDAVCVFSFVARHRDKRTAEVELSWARDCRGKGPMSGLAVPVRDVSRVRRGAPRTLHTLDRALQRPASISAVV